jgi:hydroxymethylglutaryl-CoA lyase
VDVYTILPDNVAMEKVTIVEVCPRDGLQNEKIPLHPDQRIDLIHQLAAAGARRIEAVSFVNPKLVPQMAGAEEVMAGLDRGRGVAYSGLVLNRKGAERALAAGVDEINVVVPSTEAMSRANQNVGVAEMTAAALDIAEQCRSAGVPVTISLAVAFGCPFEGAVTVDRVAALMAQVAPAADELALADTIGVGVPGQVRALVAAAGREAPGVPLRFHFHNTRNTGYANAEAAMREGVVILDASVGGFGGCPFSPGASGNIGTEDLDYLATASGFDTGLDRPTLVATTEWLSELLERQAPAMLGRAAMYPPALAS